MPSEAPSFPTRVAPGSLLTLFGTPKLEEYSPLVKQMHAILIKVGTGPWFGLEVAGAEGLGVWTFISFFLPGFCQDCEFLWPFLLEFAIDGLAAYVS